MMALLSKVVSRWYRLLH